MLFLEKLFLFDISNVILPFLSQLNIIFPTLKNA